ncbi:MAG: AMIN domain-containing protein [Hormoscilla sp.]
MKKYAIWGGMLYGAAVAIAAARPAWAAPTEVTAVRVNQTNAGIEVTLETKGDKRPQVFAVPSGNSWMADIINTQLKLPEGNSFRQDDPAPGIAVVTVKQQNTNSIRVTVTGKNGPITGGVINSNGAGMTFSIKSQAIVAQSNTPTTTPPRPQLTQNSPVSPGSASRTTRGTQPVQLPRIQNGSPVWPQAQNVAPPLRPRAIAPPVGDISISTLDSSASTINLGSTELVPRLVLRDAPVRDVLSLLARVAGLNLAYSIAEEESQGQTEEADVGPTITLDVENEPVQDVFNNILRLTGLEANRIGRTIFVGKKLPIAASQIVTRTLRLNQVPVETAAAFLAIQGAFSQRVVTKTTRTTQGEGVERVVREETETAIEPLTAAQGIENIGPLLLKGLSVVTDERLNAITLIGEARKVEMATALLTQQDLRRRQVAVNVKIIDVNLSAQDNFNSSFSFGIGDSFFVVDGGQGVANFGRLQPPSAQNTIDNDFGRPIVPNPLTQQPFQQDGPRIFQNPDGTQLIRDPASGEFVPVGPNQPGSIFSPGGLPNTPGITDLTRQQQLPAGAAAPLYLDAQGIPRPANELTVGGGNIAPFINPEGQLVEARAVRVGNTGVPVQYFDFQGNPRLPSELANPGNIEGFTGSIQPLLNPSGNPVTAVNEALGTGSATSPLFFDVNGIPRTLSQLTTAGGLFQPLLDGGNELIQAGVQATGLVPFIGSAAQFAFGLPEAFQYPRQFLAQLQASVLEDNAKILTDPTLTVQEGETATVNLTQRVPINVEITREVTEAGTTTETETEFEDVGLLLPIRVERIDDNGFISLAVEPKVSTVVGTFTIPREEGDQNVFQTAKRELNSGTIRLRDGQTLILAGIIQEQDREVIRKVPILGDLPIIGSLFRSRESEDIRNEVVIVITPRIIEDTERANFGYGYRPGPGVQQMMPQGGFLNPNR